MKIFFLLLGFTGLFVVAEEEEPRLKRGKGSQLLELQEILRSGLLKQKEENGDGDNQRSISPGLPIVDDVADSLLFPTKKTKVKPIRVFEHELPPNAATRFLIETFKDELKLKAKPILNPVGPEQENELANAPIEPLAFILVKNDRFDIYFIRFLLGKVFIFHTKIIVELGGGKGLFGLDGGHTDLASNRYRFTVGRVTGFKEEDIKLNKEEFV